MTNAVGESGEVRAAAAAEPGAVPPVAGSARRQIRGSGLLLVGRGLSMAVNFGVQLLIVRYLSKGDFGAFAYALSLVATAEALCTFGLDRAITRFVPIYHEREDYPRVFGTIFMVVAAILAIGAAVVLFVQGLTHLWSGVLIDDPLAARLLLILIFLGPLQAFDDVLIGLFAVFANPRAIFFRKYVLAPLLRLTVVVLLIVRGSGATFLAAGYVLAGLVGILVYTAFLWREMRTTGLLAHLQLSALRFPVVEVLSFTVPLLTSDLVYVVMHSLDAVLLGRYYDAIAVGAFKVVQPAAKLNQLVLSSFGILFTPAAARMFAREDRRGMNDLYWRNAAWITVLSFPIFVLTFSLARPLTVLFYGQRYAQSGIILALLSLGYYFNAALGQNGLTLKVYGRVRYVVLVNILATVVNVAANLVLIPRFGALGAALGTCATLIAFNLFKQVGLRLGTGISLLHRAYVKLYVLVGLSAAGLLFLQLATSLPDLLSFALGAVASLAVLRLSSTMLDVERTFPELARLPVMRPLLGLPPRAP